MLHTSTASSTSRRTWAIGTPDEVLTTETLSRLYDTEVDVLRVRGRVVVVGTPDDQHVHHVGERPLMFTQLLDQHFVHTALWAGAVVAVVSGAIGVFVVARGMSFAVHAISELGFTGAAGALVVGIDPVLGLIGGSLVRRRSSSGSSRCADASGTAPSARCSRSGSALGVLFLSLYQGYATEATNLLFGSIVGVSDPQLRTS